jgi:hypothetical protein
MFLEKNYNNFIQPTRSKRGANSTVGGRAADYYVSIQRRLHWATVNIVENRLGFFVANMLSVKKSTNNANA